MHIRSIFNLYNFTMKSANNEIITEIAPIKNKFDYYAIARNKTEFDYPVHRHDAYELNFLFGCRGARRIVGDSIEELGDFDLVLIGPGIEHGWEMHKCTSKKIKEFTIQFGPGFYVPDYLRGNGFGHIARLLEQSANGVAFGIETVLRTFYLFEAITNDDASFDRMFNNHKLMDILGRAKDFRPLASSTFSHKYTSNDSRRITKVQTYINEHITQKIRLIDLANIAGMTESSFSRFFKLHTGFSVSEYIMDMRLGEASRRLVYTKMSVSEICYECGFNNVSHFSRCFRERKKCTPTDFRAMYKQKD